MELGKLHDEFQIEESNPYTAFGKSLSSVVKLRHQQTALDFDKILNDQGVMDNIVDPDEPKKYSDLVILGRFYGPPTSLSTDYTYELLNDRDTSHLRLYLAALNLYNRIVSLLEAIIRQSSSSHHSSDFIRCSQKHLLLKGKVSNTVRILDELIDSKKFVGHPLETLFEDYVSKYTRNAKLPAECWRWMVRNSKMITAMMKRLTMIEAIELAARRSPGRSR